MDHVLGNISEAAVIIRRGGLVAFPTETVYGLGADATNPAAVARIFEVKERPKLDPLIVHIAEHNQISQVVKSVPPKAAILIEKFWPGPLTLILQKQEIIADIVTSGLPGVGIRMPDNETARTMISLSGKPVAAPSANKFGSISPTCAAHVSEQLNDSVDMILDGGNCSIGVESTIISFMYDDPLLLRPGGLSLESIQKEIGKIIIPDISDHKNASPGRCLRHYAPLTPLQLIQTATISQNNQKIGLLTLKEKELTDHFTTVEILSKTGNLNEAACNLFAALRRLDAAGLDLIIAEPVPDEGLGRAINDRLYRASIKRSGV
ncbi:MAG TPA: L-threonylcarbamoyladenylate synthase [Chitinispirillaceae bacterium]|nr:L-threonylcarbamoyladenylate synthase [Chitinispirillaceae bacterium]